MQFEDEDTKKSNSMNLMKDRILRNKANFGSLIFKGKRSEQFANQKGLLEFFLRNILDLYRCLLMILLDNLKPVLYIIDMS
ncbi:hypothetical protein PCE01_12640 [Pediococcus cellicola]|nr:hypothetical protein PCE01_12640 [Pediococcus cellicola]